jgi:sugar lactone lactonase YvrE
MVPGVGTWRTAMRLRCATMISSSGMTLCLAGLATIIASLLVSATSLPSEPQHVVTIAGNGPFLGDGDIATNANLNLLEGVAVDAAGNLFIADANNNRIRKIDAGTGTISTFAGSGLVGFSGDGGPAIDARLNSPSDLDFDVAGNLYFTDAGNDRVRRVDGGTHMISTVAGTGIAGYSGDGGSAVAAQLNNPRGIAVVTGADGPSIYTADLRNNVVRKIDETGIITTVAGTGVAGISPDGGLATATPLNTPFGLTLDAAGNLFIGEGGLGAGSHRIRKVDAATTVMTTVAGIAGSQGSSPDGTLATAAMINSPRDIAFDSEGILYFVDNGTNRIRVVNLSAATASIFGRPPLAPGTIATIAGAGVAGFSGDEGPATSARLFGPFFIALDGVGNLYVGDRGNSRVRRVDRATGTITTLAGGFTPASGDGGAATSANLSNPAGLALDASGSLYVAENGANRVRKIDAATGIITTVVGTGSAGGSGDGGLAIEAQLNAPQGVTVDRSGNLYIADSSNGRVRKVDARYGTITTVAGTGVLGSSGDGGAATLATLSTFRGIALDASENLWIADSVNHRVRFVNLSPTPVSVAGHTIAPGNIARIVGTTQGSSGDEGLASAARINLPLGLAFDSTGNLYISEQGQRIRFVNLSDAPVGIHGQVVGPYNITTIAGTGVAGDSGDGCLATAAQLFGPQGLAIDVEDNLYIADTNNNRIRKVDTTGVITHVAGIGAPGFSGDGGSAVLTALNNPRFVAFDAGRNLHVAEFGGNRVRRLNLAAQEISVVRNAAGVTARVEVPVGRSAADLAGVTLTTINSSGSQLSAPFPGADLGPDPADPANPRRRAFGFGLEPALLGGGAFRLVGRFATDSRWLSGDAAYSLAWDDPADIVHGTPLSAAELDATATVPGTFFYTAAGGVPAYGAVLAPGARQVLFVRFVPDDGTKAPATASASIDVNYSSSGFQAPINPDGSSVFGGSVVPVKFALTGASAGITKAGAHLFVAKVTGGIVGTEQPATTASPNDGNLFRYDSQKQQYIYSLRTKALSPGTWRLRIDLHDGVERTVLISLRP